VLAQGLITDLMKLTIWWSLKWIKACKVDCL